MAKSGSLQLDQHDRLGEEIAGVCRAEGAGAHDAGFVDGLERVELTGG